MEIVNLRRGVRGVSDTNSDQELAPKRAAKLTAKQERFAKLIVQERSLIVWHLFDSR